MDKFVVKTTRPKPTQDKEKEVPKKMKQSTIGSLQGVVVMEDILFCKSKLTIPNQSKDIIMQCLQTLGEKIPPKHVLLSTKIGHVVSKLRHHVDKEIAQEAKRIYVKWRSHVEKMKERPQIEVKCDVKTEGMRLRGKTFISEALCVERSHPIVEAVEREAFHQNKRLNSTSYRRTMREMIFKLKHNESLRESLLKGDLPVEEFVKQYRKR